ncbi:MAG: hypothetical protein NC209_03805 [Alistipes sp.]|nr:hypothetical protein [Alistipes sp.]MCM1301902.1 hypothetical protein [Bacteroides cellulosilyticus]
MKRLFIIIAFATLALLATSCGPEYYTKCTVKLYYMDGSTQIAQIYLEKDRLPCIMANRRFWGMTGTVLPGSIPFVTRYEILSKKRISREEMVKIYYGK